MEDREALVRANRQMMAERTALLAERDAYRQLAHQLAVDTAVRVIEGLGLILTKAESGDPAAKTVLNQLADRLEQVRLLRARIVLPNGPS